MPRVLHVITGLDVGGAEATLARLVSRLDPHRFPSSVLSLKPEGPLASTIRAAGIEVASLGMTSAASVPHAVRECGRRMRELRPDVVQTWMYHADLVGALAVARLDARPVLLWGVRQTEISRRTVKPATLATAHVCARLSSRLPDRIVCCSHASADAHARFGYDGSRTVVIRNGFDAALFAPDPDARRTVRRELGVGEDALLVCLVGRLDPVKGHVLFLDAMREVVRRHPPARVVLVGPGVVPGAEPLAGCLRDGPLSGRAHLLGAREDVPALLAAMDVVVSASTSEGFPNVVGEAMASGVPCVATAVGDVADLIGDAGALVRPGDAGALAEAISTVLSMGADERRRLGAAGRDRVVQHFSLERTAEAYAALYEERTDVRHRRTP